MGVSISRRLEFVVDHIDTLREMAAAIDRLSKAASVVGDAGYQRAVERDLEVIVQARDELITAMADRLNEAEAAEGKVVQTVHMVARTERGLDELVELIRRG